ncbi:MAG: hypothetical protein PHS24_04785 [Bacilli bacterium]|nr:hypothetical protein [Bacilli bacterium]
MAKKGQNFKKYEDDYILKIVSEKLKGKLYSYLEREYFVPNSTTTWVKRYNDKGTTTKEDNRWIINLKKIRRIMKKYDLKVRYHKILKSNIYHQ